MRNVIANSYQPMGDVKILQGLSGRRMPMVINRAVAGVGDPVSGDPQALQQFGRSATGAALIGGALVVGLLGFLVYRTYTLEMAR